MLALLDALRLERVKLVGHDWGGWSWVPDVPARARADRALPGAQHPPAVRPIEPLGVLSLWRLWYQWVIAAPRLGEWTVRQAVGDNPVPMGGRRAAVWNDEERESFLGQLREPGRARATVQYYRSFQVREIRR